MVDSTYSILQTFTTGYNSLSSWILTQTYEVQNTDYILKYLYNLILVYDYNTVLKLYFYYC